jgi:hypothetical protein
MARTKKLDEKEFERQVRRVLARHVRATKTVKRRKDRAVASPQVAPTEPQPDAPPYSFQLMEATREFQKQHVLAALETHLLAGRWNMAAAARALGVSRLWVYKFVRELDGPVRTVQAVRLEFPRVRGRAATVVVARPFRSTIRNEPSAAPLLAEVKQFHDAVQNGDYYESFNVNSKNYMEKSRRTEAFIAKFDRLLTECVQAAAKPPREPVRAAFELLFALLRRIDEDSHSIVFFADEGGAWQVGVEWQTALPAYFQCLAATSTGDEFAREVEGAISDFDEYAKPKHRAAARSVANAEQKAALARVSKTRPSRSDSRRA